MEAGTSYRFKVEEIRPCACALGGELSSNTLLLEDVIIFNILAAINDSSSEDEVGGVDGEHRQVGPEPRIAAALAREQRRKKLAEKVQKVQKANESAEVHDGESFYSF